MLAKAVAHHTSASFIRVVGSEFVQKYLGEGPRMVRDVFRYSLFLIDFKLVCCITSPSFLLLLLLLLGIFLYLLHILFIIYLFIFGISLPKQQN